MAPRGATTETLRSRTHPCEASRPPTARRLRNREKERTAPGLKGAENLPVDGDGIRAVEAGFHANRTYASPTPSRTPTPTGSKILQPPGRSSPSLLGEEDLTDV